MTYNAKIHGVAGDAEDLVVESGGTITVKSGGVINIETGGVVQANGAAVSAIADLDQDISATYVEAEVQAISDKVDAILAALRSLGLVAAA